MRGILDRSLRSRQRPVKLAIFLLQFPALAVPWNAGKASGAGTGAFRAVVQAGPGRPPRDTRGRAQRLDREAMMFQSRCSECGAKCAEPVSIRIKGRWSNLCPRCAAVHRQKAAAAAKGQNTSTVLLLLGAFLLVVGVLVWFIFFAK